MSFFKEIEIPNNFTVNVSEHSIKVSNGKNSIEKRFKAANVLLEKKDSVVVVKTDSKNRKNKSIVNTIASIIQNMFQGLNQEFEYKLSMVYSHFPMTLSKKEGFVEINNFLGGKRVLKSKIIGSFTKVEIKGKDISIKGPNKEETGQTAANLEKTTKVYNKDRRIFQDGIYITQKAK